MKRTLSSSTTAVTAAAAISATPKMSATAMRAIKLQQFAGLLAIIVAVNCIKINLISAAFAAASDEDHAEVLLNEIRKKCFNSTSNLTTADQELILDHKLFTPNTTLETTSKAIQCYCLCYLHESEIFKDNAPNEKFLREILPIMINDKKKASATMDKCMKLEGNDKCEIGFNFELCLIMETSLYIY